MNQLSRILDSNLGSNFLRKTNYSKEANNTIYISLHIKGLGVGKEELSLKNVVVFIIPYE